MAGTVHLVCGPVGAGKTTHARALAAEMRGVVFTIDEWVVTLFAPDAPGKVTAEWLEARIVRCEALIGGLVRALLGRDVDVVLDLGFMRRSHRDLWRGAAVAAGARAVLHSVTAPLEVRRERVHARNRERGPTFYVPVSDGLFDWMETQFEPPSADEVG